MSRGPGRLQRDILDILDQGGEWRWGAVRTIKRGVPCRTDPIIVALHVGYGWDWANDWFDRQVRRALTSLERQGLVTSTLIPNMPHYPHKTVRLWTIACTSGHQPLELVAGDHVGAGP